MKFKDLLFEYITFLREPFLTESTPKAMSLSVILKVYLCVFFFGILLFAPVAQWLGIEQMPHAIDGLFNEYKFWQIFLLAVVIAPVIEEFIFRFHLKYERLSLLFTLLVLYSLAYLVADYYLGLTAKITAVAANISFVLASTLIVTLGFAIPFLILSSKISSQTLKADKSWTWLNFPFVFYLTTMTFAFVHVYNFSLEPDYWYMAPFMVIPQFILGLYIGFIRVRTTIFHGIFIHMLNNSIPMIALFLSQKFF